MTRARPIAISIVIPTCNRPAYVQDAVRSAAKAAPPACEIIVVNDGDPVDIPTPDTNTIPLRVIPNTRAKGAAGARNCGVDAARGAWIFFLDDDDLAVPGYWDHIAQAVLPSLQPNAPVYGFCDFQTFADRDQTIQAIAPPIQPDTQRTLTKSHHKLAGLGAGFWVSRATFLAVGGIDENLSVNEDTDFCLTLLGQNAQVVAFASPGVRVFAGVHDGQTQTSVTKATQAAARAANFDRIAHKHAALLKQDLSLRNWVFSRLVKHHARATPFAWPKALAQLGRGGQAKYGLQLVLHAIIARLRAKT